MSQKVDIIKQKLLEFDIVDKNSIYLEKYVQLLEENVSREKIKNTTACHHCIPRCVYKYLNKESDDSICNKINLLAKDHVLAHYYLTLAASQDWFRQANANSVVACLGYKDFPDSELELITSLDSYQKVWEIFCSQQWTSQRKENYLNL